MSGLLPMKKPYWLGILRSQTYAIHLHAHAKHLVFWLFHTKGPGYIYLALFFFQARHKKEMDIPVLIKIFVIFGIILMLNRFRLNLGLSLLTGAIILGFWMGLGPAGIAESAWETITQFQTISLCLIVGMIMVMSSLMEQSGHMTRLIKSFSCLSKDGRTVGAVMPILIGLLPMPGGALFSAPMVEASMSGSTISQERKTVLNYWFRHIWEYWWPLYPGVILAVAFLEIKTWVFMSVMVSMTLFSVLAGVVFILRPIGKIENKDSKGFSWTGLWEFLYEMMPILLVIILIVALTGITNMLKYQGIDIKMDSGISVLPGLLLSLIWVYRIDRITLPRLVSVLTSKHVWSMMLLVIAIMIFKGMMDDSRAVIHIRNELITYGIPVILVILIMPFLSGLITGIAIGFVAASFPLIIPLFQSPDLMEYLSLAGLAYVFGYLGMILSPVHLCLLVSKDYYKARLINSYPLIVKPALTVMLLAIIFFSILRVL